MVGRKYETVDEFFAEIETMCNNAFTYNEDDSDIFKDAKQIKVGNDTITCDWMNADT